MKKNNGLRATEKQQNNLNYKKVIFRKIVLSLTDLHGIHTVKLG
jgi:hypothetical protein